MRFLFPYVFAFVITSLAIQLALESHFRERIFRYLYPAGFFSVWFGGLGPGILSGVYGCLVFLVIAFQDSQTSYGSIQENLVDLGLYAFFGIGFGCLVDREKKSRKRITEMYRELRAVTRQLSQREQALGMALRSRDDFFSIASHELKTPITALKLQVQLLERQLEKEEKESNHHFVGAMHLIEEQIARLTNLIESLLDTTRIAKGSLKLDLEKTDLLDLVQKIFKRYEGLLKSSGCGYSVTAEGPSTVQCDRFRMEQVMTNLLANAVKYASGKPIEIVMRHRENKIEVTFSDQGPGISEKDVKQLFVPFSRPRSGETRIPGLGLGLFIARQIMQAHGGEITCKSIPGKGTQFILSIPIDSNSHAPYAHMAFEDWNPSNLDILHQRYAATFSD